MQNRSILKAARAGFLPASIIPFLIGAAYAYSKGFDLSWLNFTLGFSGIVSAHLAANLLNDYFDYKSGADNLNENDSPFFGGSQVIQRGIYSAGEILTISLLFLFFALICGVVISVLNNNLVILIIMVLSGVLAVQYTAPPFRLAYNRLGEIDIFLLFGIFLVMGSFYLFAEKFTFGSFLVSLPIAFLIAGVIICNEIPDFEYDLRAKKNNLVLSIGKKKGYILYASVIILSLLTLFINIWLGILPSYAAVIGMIYFIGLMVSVILKTRLDNHRNLTQASVLTIMLHSFVGIGILITILKG